MTSAVLWLAVALTGWGPVVGKFDSERDCRQSVELAKVCSNVDAVSSCHRVEINSP